jgi:thymidylate synthase
MITNIFGTNVPDAYVEGLWNLHAGAIEHESRNGPVLTIPNPVVLEIARPWERVLFDPVRNCNHFFHVMEFVWMMAGSNDAEWISQFNKRMMEYADDGILRGAYGWRWANPSPQIQDTISLLQTSPTSRQAVISMWDPVFDGSRARTSDRPCNTHLYFRVQNGRLEMTVCNRSNDFFWGMMRYGIIEYGMIPTLMMK